MISADYEALKAVLADLEAAAPAQAPRDPPRPGERGYDATSENRSRGQDPVEPWWSAIDKDTYFQSLWERSQEWPEDDE